MAKFLYLIALIIFMTFSISSLAEAVHKNYNNALACGSCHTMHNTQGGASLGGSPSIILLRGVVADPSQTHNLCLQCHASNGTQSNATFGADSHPAPKVYIDGASGCGILNISTGQDYCSLDVDGNAINDAVNLGAGGDFSGGLIGDPTGWAANDGDVAFGRAHSLGLTTVSPPGKEDAELDAANFTCMSCHDPHGAYNVVTSIANVYRNLRLIPRGSEESSGVTLNSYVRSYVGMGGGATWTSGVYGAGGANMEAIWPVYRGAPSFNGSDSSADGGLVNQYAVNEPGTTGIANWCAACHDKWHEDIGAGQEGYDWRRHPVDNPLKDSTPLSGSSVTIVDTSNYQFTGKALPVASSDTAAGVYYLNATTTTDKVFCLSCHFAHGGPYFDNLRWEYTSSVWAGGQMGLILSSTTGCQQCHNKP